MRKPFTLIEGFLNWFCSVLTGKVPLLSPRHSCYIPSCVRTGICMFPSMWAAHPAQCSLLTVSPVQVLFCSTTGLLHPPSQVKNELQKKKENQLSLYIFSSAKHYTVDSLQVNYNLSSKGHELTNFFLNKTFPIIPLSNSWHFILLLAVPIRIITIKLQQRKTQCTEGKQPLYLLQLFLPLGKHLSNLTLPECFLKGEFSKERTIINQYNPVFCQTIFFSARSNEIQVNYANSEFYYYIPLKHLFAWWMDILHGHPAKLKTSW